MKVVFSRVFCMPNSNTFEMKPVSRLIDRWKTGVVADPFARNSEIADYTNDLNPDTNAIWHMDALEWLELMHQNELRIDIALLDPPYSPRQISESYKIVGRKVTMEDTQNSRLYKAAKDGLDRLLVDGGIAITCGWNSAGFGIGRGYELLEVLLVNHGAAHNDTIVTVERKSK